MSFISTSSQLQSAFYNRHAEGWHWYEEILPPDVAQKHQENPSQKQAHSSPDPIKILKTFQKKVEELKAAAVMNPTFATVKAYMAIQKELLERSSLFAQKWLEVVYQTPHLDYTTLHPISQAARHVYLDEQKKEMEARLRALSKTHGLFFFFSSSCTYCRQFAPIVKSFAQKYDWKVLAISVDGSRLPEFPAARADNGTSRELNVQNLPALFSVNPQTKHVIPLSYGMLTHDQIEDRIRVLVLRRAP